MKTSQYNFFFSRMLEKSEEQIQKLRAESSEKIKEIKNNTEKAIDEIKNIHNQEKIKNTQRLEKDFQNSLNMKSHHVHLLKQKLVNQEILKQIRSSMKNLIKSLKYSQILENWIYETTLSILSCQDETMLIQTSTNEIDLLTPDLLNRVSQRIKHSDIPCQISFLLDKKNFITDQGVIVISENQKLLCSRTLSNQLARYDLKIQSYVVNLVSKTLV